MLVTGRDGSSALYTIYFDFFAGVYRYNFSDYLVGVSTFNGWGWSVAIRCHFSIIEMPRHGTGCVVQCAIQWRHLKEINIFVMRVFVKRRECRIWRKKLRIKQPNRCVNIQHLFCHKTLHVSGIFCAHHQELSSARTEIGTFHASYVTTF